MPSRSTPRTLPRSEPPASRARELETPPGVRHGLPIDSPGCGQAHAAARRSANIRREAYHGPSAAHLAVRFAARQQQQVAGHAETRLHSTGHLHRQACVPSSRGTILVAPDVLAHALRGRDLPPRPAAGHPQPPTAGGAPKVEAATLRARYRRARVGGSGDGALSGARRRAHGWRTDASRAVGRTLEIGDPPRWDVEAPLLWQFNLHYFAFLHALPPSEQSRLVLDWIERCPPRARRPGLAAYPISLRLRHWVQWLFGAAPGELSAADRARVLASIEGQGECLADTLEHHLRGNHLLENALTLSFLAACFRGPTVVARWDAWVGGARCERELRRAVPARRRALRALADVPRAARRAACWTS